MPVKKSTIAMVLCGSVLLSGCASRDLPRGARLVGGGLQLEFQAACDGTLIYRERTTRRMIATYSIPEGGTFDFGPSRTPDWEVIMARLFSQNTPAGAVEFGPFPTNLFFELYFVPAPAKRP